MTSLPLHPQTRIGKWAGEGNDESGQRYAAKGGGVSTVIRNKDR